MQNRLMDQLTLARLGAKGALTGNNVQDMLSAQMLFNQGQITENQMRAAKRMYDARKIAQQQQQIPNVMSGFGP
jgi:hypothetical protein